MAAEGCGVGVGPDGSVWVEVGELSPGMSSSESEQELSDRTKRLTRVSNRWVEGFTIFVRIPLLSALVGAKIKAISLILQGTAIKE
jgi:hypothetical protein